MTGVEFWCPARELGQGDQHVSRDRCDVGLPRFAYVDQQLHIPADRPSELSHNIVLAGYTAPILKKVDVDYAYIRTKEARNFDTANTGDFVQYNNQINILWRFSHFMNLSIDVDTEQ